MQLQKFFRQNPRFAVAFSGGVDSSYLLYAAKAAENDVRAYFIKTEFQPQFELDDAVQMAKSLGVHLTVERLSILSEPEVLKNPSDRCYHCKTIILKKLFELARLDGYDVLCDGTNADDDEIDRPGMLALREQGVFSPLRECGIGKAEIRALSNQAGLPTFDKPAYACLATRIPTGTVISLDSLIKVERAENALFKMGFSDFRVRIIPPDTAKLQICSDQWEKATSRRFEILESLGADFTSVVLDLTER